ncbi:MAG: glycosyltransferase family 8 protein [Oscillospiraceae bacterium]|jgi:lipopolysaccharide biosynthesis glycosyltransferase|nr:glycosyltransferase family 8 protein [Oscillospiraceae bacterium]
MNFLLKKIKSYKIFLLTVLFFLFIFKYIVGEAIKKENFSIPIVISIDNNYLPQAMVATTSLLKNSNSNYVFYVLISPEFSRKDELIGLENNFENCKKINFINMGNECEDWKHGRFPKEAFYKTLIPKYLPQNIHKCIYIDVDTVILKDIKDLYQINLEGKPIGGVADSIRYFANHRFPYETKGIFDFQYYINTGVLLIDLDICREENITDKIENYFKRNKGLAHDQASINYVFYSKIKDIPLKYNVLCFFRLESDFSEDPVPIRLFTEEEWDEGRRNPVIVHFAASKPWENSSVRYGYEWWQYAKETGYFTSTEEFENKVIANKLSFN